MSAVRITKLKARGFRSFVNEIVVDFPKSGLLLISGMNKATGGSSGSGKSSLNLAISFALDICPFPATELASWPWLEPPDMRVVLSLEHEDGRTAVITRTASSRSLKLNGEEVKGGAKMVTTALAEFIGMDTDLLEAVTYRAQKSVGFFLTQPDSVKKEFLTRILKLGVFESAVDAASKKVKEIDASLPALEQGSDQWKAVLDSVNSKVFDNPPDWQAVAEARQSLIDYEGHIEYIRAQATEERSKLACIRTETGAFEQKLAECTKHLSELRSKAFNEVMQLRPTRNALVAQIDDLKRQVQGLNDVRMAIPRLEKERYKLADNKCQTCDRQWDEAATKLVEIEKVLTQHNKDLLELPALQGALLEKQKELDAITKTMENEDPLIKRLEDIKDNLTKKAIQEKVVAASKYSEAYAKSVDEENEAVANVEGLIRQWKALLEKNDRLTWEKEQHIKEYNRVYAGWEQASGLHIVALSKRAIELEFIALVGREGFLGAIFDEILEEVAVEANKILSEVANTAECSISFKSEGLTKKGAVEHSIKPFITKNGQEIPFKSGLSGGMQTATNLAVDIAIGNVVSYRTGSFPGWLILDESLEGLGVVEKETVMEILTKNASNRLIMIVDHASEFQSYFTDKIEISFQDEKSTITKAA